MIKSLPEKDQTVLFGNSIPRDRVGLYLVGLSRLCLEISRNPRLLPFFLCILKLVPGTIAQLLRAQRRLAA